jgi:hypothetical protein
LNTKHTPILIAGLPRSGTTWFGEVLSSARNIRYLFEPDNEGLHPVAWWCKRNLHRYPYLVQSADAPDYYRLWDFTFNGNSASWYLNAGIGLVLRRNFGRVKFELEAYIGERCGFRYVDPTMHWVGDAIVSPYDVNQHPLAAFVARQIASLKSKKSSQKQAIVKSVHSILSLEWISEHFSPKVIVTLRNPYSLFASYRRMKLPDGVRNLFAQPELQRDFSMYVPGRHSLMTPELEDTVAFQIMLMYKIIQLQAAGHPEWLLVSHDRLCVSPHEDYGLIFKQLNLDWSDETNKRIDALNKEGQGFAPSRVSSLQPSKWKSELESRQRMIIENWTDRFELREFFREQIDLL